jgi:hypothetical protein
MHKQFCQHFQTKVSCAVCFTWAGSKLFKDKQWIRKFSWAFQCTVLCKTSQHFHFSWRAETDQDIKIRSLDTIALQRRTEVDKINFSVDKSQDYLSGTTSRLTYISSLGYKFSARTDMWMHQTFTFTSAKCT